MAKIIEAFSLSHAQILDGSTAFDDALSLGENFDVYGVNEASLEPDTDEFENEGDDAVLSTWSWLNFAEVNVQAGYVSFGLISTMTGRAISSSGTGDNQVLRDALWHESDMNVAPRPMLIRMPAKTSDGVVRTYDIGLYKVQFKPITFEGPQYKEGLKINYAGRALMSTTDELGAAHGDGKKRVGIHISRPAV